mgnify:CR=1 FL=1
MREMKDSGISWVGEIPKEWSVWRNKYIFKITKDIVLPSKSYQLLSLTTTGIKEKDENDNGGKVPENYDGYQVVKENDLVMCLFDLDCSAVFSGLSPYNGMISPAYKVLKVKKRIANEQYYRYWFNYVGSKRFYKQYSKSLRFTLNADEFNRLFSLLPPLAEQQRIAEFLDRECGKIDGLKADIQAQIDTLEQYKRSVITEAVTHGLNPSAPMKECSVSWARQIPQHWKVMPNKHLMTKIKNICPIYKGEDILSLTMYGVIVRDLDAGGKMPSSFDGYQYIKKGNLLMCLFDIDVTPRCIGIIKQNGITSPAYSQFKMRKIANARFYYYYYLMLDYTKELLHLAKNLRHSLTEDQLGAIKQLVPPIDEQQEIADYLDNKCAEIEQIIADKKSQIETLDGYKKSLIYEYVTGKKEVICDD